MKTQTTRPNPVLRMLSAWLYLAATAIMLVPMGHAAVLYDSNGFESPTFSPGTVNGQNTWSVIAGTPANSVIQGDFYYAGTQALFIQNELNVAQTLRQMPSSAVSGDFWLDFYVFPPLVSDISSNMSLIARGNAGTAFSLQFNSGLGVTLNGITMNDKYVANDWNRITLNVNTATDQVTLYINGVQQTNGTNVAFTTAAANIYAFDFSWRSKATATPGGGFYLDNYILGDVNPIPESSAALSTIAGLFALVTVRRFFGVNRMNWRDRSSQ